MSALVLRVASAPAAPPMDSTWDHPAWAAAETVEVSHFRPESSAHRPRTRARLLRVPGGWRGIFQVDDQYVRSVGTGFLAEVWRDSCVECFLQPPGGGGYFNLEMNAGGAHLCYYIEDPVRLPGGFGKFSKLSAEEGAQIKVRSSLPAVVDPEITTPVSWTVNFFFPVSVMEKYAGPLPLRAGEVWRANFFKCGDGLSHPHWAAWSPVDELNFHLPRCFGTLLLV